MDYRDHLVRVAEGEATVAGRAIRYDLELYVCVRCGQIRGVVHIDGLVEIGGYGFTAADPRPYCQACSGWHDKSG